MSKVATDELVDAIIEIRGLFPEMRMGQLVASLTLAAGQTDPSAVWEIDDHQMLSAARRLARSNRGRDSADDGRESE